MDENNNTLDGAVMMGSTNRGYAMDFGDVFQKKPVSSRSALSSSSHPSNNENVDNNANAVLASSFQPTAHRTVGGRGTKEWQLPHYNTIEENAAYLNRQLELQQYGVHDAFTSLVFRASADDDVEVRRVMDCVHWLLHSRREEMHKSDEMAEQFIRYDKDIQRKNNQIQALTAQVEAERKTCTDLENQMNAKDAAYAKERQLFKEDKRSLERKCIQLTHVDTNYKAQLRKSEVNYERLQKQYSAYLAKSSSDKRGMALGKELNGKPTCIQIRNASTNQATIPGEHNILNTMIRSYEVQHTALLQENEALRASVAQFYAELKQATTEYRAAAKWFLHRHGNAVSQWEEQLQLPVVDESKLANAFTMPLPVDGRENLLVVLQHHLTLLRTKIARLMDATQDRDRAAMEARLQEAYGVMQEQDAMLQVVLAQDKHVTRRSDRLELSALEDMLEEVALERQELAIKAEHMASEREQFSVQAERLDKDRLEFEFERHDVLITRGTPSEFVDGGKKRHRMDSSHRPSQGGGSSVESPFAKPRDDGNNMSASSGLHLPPTPATARLLQRIGIVNEDQIMSPIASTGRAQGLFTGSEPEYFY
ncbi:hypothetical protein H257_01636 [Aphanomyces astaci]|uniref:Uncharacterized protein n=1 Tax=Aphanomyces astaci TaxID=112090 RepID=W4H4A6_APHAT|nr:hypothetical protein H257_01636 [Aphanomyces astaci]ETV86441.1 hypothetical protein H257_01636 [Aphanomyces astaci]|eukprot:XP_009823240.1 hypothetical protein H257_01636 [Aphanomyces astaci]